MKSWIASLRTSFLMIIFFTLLLGIFYPLVMVGIGQLFFHRKANGSLVHSQEGGVIGSEWIAQSFTKPEYFHPRPSNAGDKGYDATSSSGSNLGPTSQKLFDTLRQRSIAYRSENQLNSSVLIPADAVTASGSGLDPHISLANALLQVSRVAQTRGLSEDVVKDLIAKHTEGPTFGFFGNERINVLLLNFALDQKGIK